MNYYLIDNAFILFSQACDNNELVILGFLCICCLIYFHTKVVYSLAILMVLGLFGLHLYYLRYSGVLGRLFVSTIS